MLNEINGLMICATKPIGGVSTGKSVNLIFEGNDFIALCDPQEPRIHAISPVDVWAIISISREGAYSVIGIELFSADSLHSGIPRGGALRTMQVLRVMQGDEFHI